MTTRALAVARLPLTALFVAGVIAAAAFGTNPHAVSPVGPQLPTAPPPGQAIVLDPQQQTRDALAELYGGRP